MSSLYSILELRHRLFYNVTTSATILYDIYIYPHTGIHAERIRTIIKILQKNLLTDTWICLYNITLPPPQLWHQCIKNLWKTIWKRNAQVVPACMCVVILSLSAYTMLAVYTFINMWSCLFCPDDRWKEPLKLNFLA